MTHCDVSFQGEALQLCGSGALFWPSMKTLVVSDLHLGKSERIARREGTMLPPYDTRETLMRLDETIDRFAPERVICLGDSFDDLATIDALSREVTTQIAALQAGREWIWIEGNHDAGPVELGGQHRFEFSVGALVFRHIATPGARGEVSGHYHPKARISLKGRSVSRPCFATDQQRIIMPAFGAYTGGLWTSDPAISSLFDDHAHVVLTGRTALRFPMPRTGGV